MRLELDEISVGEMTQEYSVEAGRFDELQSLAGSEQFDFTSPLKFSLRLQRVGSLVELDGSLAFSIKDVCGLCLSPFEERIESTFSLTFTPQKESEPEQEDEEVELEAEELGLISYDGEQIDLHEPLQEQVVLSLPLSPLCSEQCNGLCSECGGNLNKTDCNCEKKLFNNKFASLKNLKIDS